MPPIWILEKLGWGRIMLCNRIYRIVEGMEDKEVDAAAAEPVYHPFGILQGHSPSYTVKAFDQTLLSSQLPRQ